MINGNDITVNVNAEISVDERTANVCMKMLELYLNKTGRHIREIRKENGEVELRYEPVR